MELDGLAMLGLGISIGGIALSWAWQNVNKANNRVIKELTGQTQNLITATRQELQLLITEEGRLSRESTEKMGEKLGALILADGERTRELLREIKQSLLKKL